MNNKKINVGDIKILTNLDSRLNGLKVEIISYIDDEIPYFEVKLLEVPPLTCYKIGDQLSVYKYQLIEGIEQ